MLKIENLHVSVEGKEILKGVSLEVKKGEVHAIMGPNGSGKSTLSSVIAGNEDYEVTKGNIYFNDENIEDLSAEERAHKGIFMSFQYPVEIPGITVTNFIKTAINSNLKARGLKEMPANEMLKKIREKANLLEIDSRFLSRSLNEGFSGGEKKRNEIFQMAMLEPTLAILDETDSGLDIDALRIVASGVNKLKNKGVKIETITLHIGLGTFRPVQVEDLNRHQMDSEYFEVSTDTSMAINQARKRHRKIVAVGTSTVRALETIAISGFQVTPKRGWTDKFIYPPYEYKMVDRVITNFHSPQSTLLMMVSAFAGRKLIKKAYLEAKKHDYRFLSYGDAMIII